MSSSGRSVYRLSDIVHRFGGQVLGDADVRITQVATLDAAGPGQISFLANRRYRKQLEQTRADAVIVAAHDADATERPRIVCDDPYTYFAHVSALLNPPSAVLPGVHRLAVIHASARVAASAAIGPFVWVGAGAEVGEGSAVDAGCAIGENVRIGRDCRLYPNVSVYHDCVIGDRVILHSGAVIGADGFGLAWDGGRWKKIPQIGRVILGDDVEIGANTTIDRGALDDTVLEEGVKLDNQIQIGHNCRIGAHTAMAGCAGIAGSTRVGRYCRIGGGAIIAGHLEIADRVEIAGGAAVPKSILEPGTYSSFLPAAPHRDWLRTAAHIRHLDSLVERVRTLETRLAEWEGKKNG